MRVGALAPGQVCLTFDDGPGATVGDGPGPRTVELASYLADEGIVATFFMCGGHVAQHPDVPERVRALGHAIGTHTHSHPHLPGLGDDEIRAEVRGCRDALAAVGVGGPLPFRPPYGDWDTRCAAAVEAAPDLRAHVAEVWGWDVDGRDWEIWSRGGTAEECARDYLGLLVEARGGVVLMHDSTADPGPDGARMRARNRTLEAVRLLVPALREAGLRFVALPG